VGDYHDRGVDGFGQGLVRSGSLVGVAEGGRARHHLGVRQDVRERLAPGAGVDQQAAGAAGRGHRQERVMAVHQGQVGLGQATRRCRCPQGGGIPADYGPFAGRLDRDRGHRRGHR
jgi:hypothetical protein